MISSEKAWESFWVVCLFSVKNCTCRDTITTLQSHNMYLISKWINVHKIIHINNIFLKRHFFFSFWSSLFISLCYGRKGYPLAIISLRAFSFSLASCFAMILKEQFSNFIISLSIFHSYCPPNLTLCWYLNEASFSLIRPLNYC